MCGSHWHKPGAEQPLGTLVLCPSPACRAAWLCAPDKLCWEPGEAPLSWRLWLCVCLGKVPPVGHCFPASPVSSPSTAALTGHSLKRFCTHTAPLVPTKPSQTDSESPNQQKSGQEVSVSVKLSWFGGFIHVPCLLQTNPISFTVLWGHIHCYPY